jgi:DNA-directed RNA polymerase specialized sigma24 family protein
MHQCIYDGIDADVVRIAAKRANQLIRQIGFSLSDLEDIQQELICAALEQLPRFDPQIGKKTTFITGIMERKAAQLFRNRTREKRHPSLEAFSLDEPPPDAEDEDCCYGDTVADSHDDEWRLRALIIDVGEAIASLPQELQKLAKFHAQLRPDEARREAGLAKSSHNRAMRKMRDHFVRLGVMPSAHEVGTDHEGTGNQGEV